MEESPLMLDRRSQIADIVQQLGAVRVQDLAARFQVSSVTIRSDLAQLEREGMLVRDRGGAVARGAVNATVRTLTAFEQRTELHHEQKQRIGQVAARLVTPGDSIIIDAGTTTVQMVPHLRRATPLTVVTNGLNVAAELRSVGADVLLLGGSLNYTSLSTLGPIAEQSLAELTVQKLFLAAQAIDLQAGLTDTTPEIAQVKRAMVRAARQVILLADSSKWGKVGFIKVIALQQVHTVITDSELPAASQSALERLGIELIVA